MRINECYRKLGLSPGASLKEVEQAYSDLSKVWHPNRFGSDIRLKRMAEEKLREITYAHEALVSSIKGQSNAIPSFTRVNAKQVSSRGNSNLLVSYRDGNAPYNTPKPVVRASSRRTAYLTALALICLSCLYLFFPGEKQTKSTNENTGTVIEPPPTSLSANSKPEAAATLLPNSANESARLTAEPAEPLNEPLILENNEPLFDKEDKVDLDAAGSSPSPHGQYAAHPEMRLPENTSLDRYFENPSSDLETLVDQVLKEKPPVKRHHKKRTTREAASP